MNHSNHSLRSSIIILVLLSLSLFFAQCKAQKLRFTFEQKAHMIPHPDKEYRGGEDAFYASENLLVVADGVGGWNAQGVDPRAQVYYNENPDFYDSNPLQLIVKTHSKNNYIGSSTMVVLTLDQDNLRSCYIGDSGFIVIRIFETKPMVIYTFTEQQHAFNFPFQLAMKKYNGDDPRHSICGSLDIRDGDIVVVGSDGLFDNIFVDEILATIQDSLIQREQTIFELPKLFAQEAIKRGQNDTFSSPFSQRAQDLGIDFEGGKLDDTTVIIARIKEIKPQKKQQAKQL